MQIELTQKPEWQEKVWGRTKCVIRGTNFEVHELLVKKGGFCSRHQHRKWNLFHVLSGQIVVELFAENETGGCGEHAGGRSLEAGDEFRVAPEQFHRFVATEDCHLLEVYWTDNIDPLDINRADEGGILTL